MKKIIGLVVILAALVLGGYYGTGVITERTLKKNVNSINQSGGIYVETKEYNRGWFTSTAKFNVLLQVPERVVKNQDGQSTTIPAQNYTMDIPLKIYHGPVIFANSGVQFGLGYASSKLELPEPFAGQFSEHFTTNSTRPQMDISLLVNYLNRSRLRVNVPTFKLIAKDGGQFEWLGMTNDVTISSNLDRVDGSITIDGMNLNKDKMQAIVGKIVSDYDLHQTQEGLYLGDANLTLPSVVVKENDQLVFELQQFTAHSSSDIDAGLFSSYFNSSIDKLIAHGKTYGPGILKISIKNLDAQVLAQINQLANKMQQDPTMERQQAVLTILPQLPKLFSKGAVFEISKASFVMPEGALEGSLLISLPKGDINNPFQLIQKVQGEGKVKVPALVLQNVMKASARQQLMQPQSAVQQALTSQMQSDSQAQATPEQATAQATPAQATPAQATPAQATPAQATPAQATPAQATPAQATPAQAMPAQATAADIEEKAKVQAEQKLAGLVQAGLLTKEGNDYVVQFKLAEGQLTVNGQPFNPAMMKF